MKVYRTTMIVSLVAFLASACGTSGFDEIKSRQRAQTKVAPPKPQVAKVENKPTRGYPWQKKSVQTPAEEAPLGDIPPVIASANPVATPLPPPGAGVSASSQAAKVEPAKLMRIAASKVTVGKGETLFAVSRRTGVSFQDLAKANNLQKPYALETGAVLNVPAMRYHVVQSGETASSIARNRGVPLMQLASMNEFDDIMSVQLGQKLRLPLDLILPPTADQTGTMQTAKLETSKPASQPQTVSNEPATEAAQEQEETAALPQPAAGAPMPVFSWPLDGKILSGFGPKPNGQYNDGLNIAARVGQSVRAAADGEVVYASNQLKGFGNLLLVRHKSGWLTAYAHNDALLVKKGNQVQRGEVIARAGATGSVRVAQLHFEVRHNRKPVNPMRILPEKNVTVLTSNDTNASSGSTAP
jgi:murein DD-endopeptidase MepM/ murein hydrolase activator NlpD